MRVTVKLSRSGSLSLPKTPLSAVKFRAVSSSVSTRAPAVSPSFTASGASLISRKSISLTSGVGVPTDASPPPSLSVPSSGVTPSLTIKPSLTVMSSKISRRPSPSVSVVDVKEVGCPSPRSVISSRSSLSESASKKSGVISGVSAPESELTGVKPWPLAAPPAIRPASKLSSSPSRLTSIKLPPVSGFPVPLGAI